jgi:hypothetical protein
MMTFTAVMFMTATVVAFSVTSEDSVRPALAGGLLAAGLIADLFLVRLIYQAAKLYQEAQRWTVGAVLTFPFGTLVFAWLLVKRLRQEKPVAPRV